MKLGFRVLDDLGYVENEMIWDDAPELNKEDAFVYIQGMLFCYDWCPPLETLTEYGNDLEFFYNNTWEKVFEDVVA